MKSFIKIIYFLFLLLILSFSIPLYALLEDGAPIFILSLCFGLVILLVGWGSFPFIKKLFSTYAEQEISYISLNDIQTTNASPIFELKIIHEKIYFNSEVKPWEKFQDQTSSIKIEIIKPFKSSGFELALNY